MCRYRTIKSAYAEIKAADPNTALTEYRIRQMVLLGEIPSQKAGNKYLVDIDAISPLCEVVKVGKEG